MHHAQLTRAQGVFSIRGPCTGWGLDFIAANLDTPTTVLHYPSVHEILAELQHGYEYVGIGFVNCTFPKAVELATIVRKNSPASRIIFGGYGTVIPESDLHADHVCREEGVGFMRRLLRQPPIRQFESPEIVRTLEVLTVATQPEAILAAGLGCSRGCDFCCTSHFFGRRQIPLLRTGREIHEAMMRIAPGSRDRRTIGVIDEDFLADRRRAIELHELNRQVLDRPIFFSCLASMASICQYSDEELLGMGLAGVWLGVESKQADYPKLTAVDAGAVSDFEFCAFLGGTVHADSLKWVLGCHVTSGLVSYGQVGPVAMELFQNAHHAFRRRFLAYANPRASSMGGASLLLGLVDRDLRRAAGRFFKSIVRRPQEFFRPLYVQSLSVVQPVDILPNGEMDTCDGCPNRTYWSGRLVPACRLDEYKRFGGPVTAVPVEGRTKSGIAGDPAPLAGSPTPRSG